MLYSYSAIKINYVWGGMGGSRGRVQGVRIPLLR